MNLVLNETQYELLKKNLLNEDGVISEATGWNTFFDVVGIFDPSGIVDFLNGVSYLKQGDTVFGLLSMISVLPFIGDLAAKPLLLLGKSGAVIRKTELAMKMVKAGEMGKATKIIQDLSKTNKHLSKLKNTVRTWGPKLIEGIDNLPKGYLFQGLRTTIIDWIRLFTNANQGSRSAIRMARRVSKLPPGARLKPSEAENILKKMNQLAQSDQRLFKDLGGKPMGGMFSDPKGYAKWSMESFKKYPFSGGIGRVWGNRQVRGLMRNTKWWLGFLDYIGGPNFVGPDELEKQIGDYTSEINDYSQTPESKKHWNEDFAQTGSESAPEQTQTTQTKPQSSGDLLSNLLFGGIPGIKPGVPGI
jgi:hypothetical protein